MPVASDAILSLSLIIFRSFTFSLEMNITSPTSRASLKCWPLLLSLYFNKVMQWNLYFYSATTSSRSSYIYATGPRDHPDIAESFMHLHTQVGWTYSSVHICIGWNLFLTTLPVGSWPSDPKEEAQFVPVWAAWHKIFVLLWWVSRHPAHSQILKQHYVVYEHV